MSTGDQFEYKIIDHHIANLDITYELLLETQKQQLNLMGLQGWELVNTIYLSDKKTILYYFKRKI